VVDDEVCSDVLHGCSLVACLALSAVLLQTSSSPVMALSRVVLCTVCMLAVLASVQADLYLHNMRGSNNRLNEQSANRQNADRLFDSEVSQFAKMLPVALWCMARSML
jgi:hypothetical protein